jgi:serine/threonine protein phosphatase PrpC
MGLIDTERPNGPLAGGRVSWRALGASVRGSSHERSGLPNQDALTFEPGGDRPADSAILVVSDGHGDPTCFRSATGSAFAVGCARDVLARYRAARERDPLASADGVTDEILRAWYALVDADLTAKPFTDAEFAAAEQRRGRSVRAQVNANPRLAYGATLIAALVTSEYCLYAQIGDGDLLVLDGAGSTRRVFAPDPDVSGSETHSLCSTDAARRFRLQTEQHAAQPHALVLASTDGYANSFGHDADYVKIARDYHALINEHGIATVQERLESLLRAASTAGSQDDITLGIISRVGAQVQAAPAAAAAQTAQTPSGAGASRSSPWQFAIAFVVLLAAVYGGSRLERVVHHEPVLSPLLGPVTHRANASPAPATRASALRFARAGHWNEAAIAYDAAAANTPADAQLDAEAALVVTLTGGMARAEQFGASVADACPSAALIASLAANVRDDGNAELLRLPAVNRLMARCAAAKPHATSRPKGSHSSPAGPKPNLGTPAGGALPKVGSE